MCSYATGLENKYMEKGMQQGMQQGLKALVVSLREFIPEFDTLYATIIKNEDFADVSRDDVMKYYTEVVG